MVPVEPELEWKEAHAYSHEITERIATASAGSLPDLGGPRRGLQEGSLSTVGA